MATDPETAKLLRQQAAAESQQQYGRRASLNVLQYAPQVSMAIDFGDGPIPDVPVPKTLLNPTQVLDLSNMHFQFSVLNQDDEGPDNCAVRVFNLKKDTVQLLLKYKNSKLVLQAGYGSNFGIIFQGDVKQFRVGRLNQTDTYVDILAADGDFGYNSAVISTTLSAQQNTRAGQLRAINDSMKDKGVTIPQGEWKGNELGGIVEGFRGKVMYGMARSHLRDLCNTEGSTWTIQNGVVQITPLESYLPGEAVVLTAATGLIDVPEATQDGIKARCLINPKLRIGGRVQINNASINQTVSGVPVPVPVPGLQFPFNQFAGIQNFASVTADGFYRVYIAEHTGDTRGNDWYTDLTCLAIDSSSGNLVKVGE